MDRKISEASPVSFAAHKRNLSIVCVTRPSVRVHLVAGGTCSVPGNFFQVGVCSRYNARSDWLIVTGTGRLRACKNKAKGNSKTI